MSACFFCPFGRRGLQVQGEKKILWQNSEKLLQTKARGRVGSIVYYVRKGEQVARSLSQSTTNPQTSAQMTTRVSWNNLVQFFKRSRFWMHWGAFEDKKKTWSDYNAFMSANASKMDVSITKEQAAAGYAVVADYVVTKGSLPTVNMSYSNNKYISDIYFGEDADFDESSYVGELSQMLLDNNNGLQAGDQISFIVYLQGGNANAPTLACRAFEMILDTADTTPIEDIFGSFLTIGYEGANGALSMAFEGQGGATIIVSREVSGKLKVSSQTLVLDSVQQNFLAQFTTPEARRRAARSYGSEGAQNFLSAGYSNVSSEGDAPTTLSILSVNGKTAGQAASVTNANTLTVVFSEAVDPATCNLKVTWYSLDGETEELNMVTDETESSASIVFSPNNPIGSAAISKVAGTVNDVPVEILFEFNVG